MALPPELQALSGQGLGKSIQDQQRMLSKLSGSDWASLSKQMQQEAAAAVDGVVKVVEANPAAFLSVGAVLLLSVAAVASRRPSMTTPYPSGVYDKDTAAEYFRERPVLFFSRGAQIAMAALGFGVSVGLDLLMNKYEENEGKRADQATTILTELGPTFIKIGQSLSIRSDLLSPEYLRALTQLQDKVPEFSTETAIEIIKGELGRDVSSVYDNFDRPIAAASLGQVYRARLKDGREVAVKVQRPNILERIALDMHLIRESAPLLKKLGAPGDIEGLVDDWGFGFVNELDYRKEGENAEAFMESISKTPLVVAGVYTRLMAGGGAANIDVNAVFSELQDLTEKYGNLFQIPPYFAYIARAFGVLEGIGLSNNPKYAIISECLPYISQRLLTDTNPRTAGALNTFIFGADKDKEDRLLDVERVEWLLDGYSSYQTAAGGGSLVSAAKPITTVVEEAAEQLSSLLLTEDDSPVQAIVLEQLARILNAGVRGTWTAIRNSRQEERRRTRRTRTRRRIDGGISGKMRNGRTLLGMLVDPLGIFRGTGIFTSDEDDRRVMEATQRLLEVVQRQSVRESMGSLRPQELRAVAAIVVRKLWDKRAKLLLTSNKLASTALRQSLQRLERRR
ncbi:hypothetical protein GUITHDRAFT_137316 [Guillardia theta CCMP2712]|uniref:ABC1 atypical kinase-like domain-containing protein n=1 Tax=Guillardia theta (strain CCMP2712) TaxID=905079 RepID=L1JG87_GUITC|nr:hypothetical protein GUITHDRAFT_137316 [Guillardia theta CCMP2712]EKX47533.1 hypothetical protein GUITHDRAFT_137316 [Guillardia theta CCMP2712]|eukprot:XP_005834513.1 hypothetical protein GUITHDRAFT_137316 [Guillardia theta CCMP2712]